MGLVSEGDNKHLNGLFEKQVGKTLKLSWNYNHSIGGFYG